jgi:hypothetical protein
MFAYARKLPGEKAWYHWNQKGLKNLPEPPNNEYSLYLEKNGAGDEFRANVEIIEAFF